MTLTDEELHVNINPAMNYFSTDPLATTFHEISHYAGSDDGQDNDDFKDAYRLEELLLQPLRNWGPYRLLRRDAERCCEQGENSND